MSKYNVEPRIRRARKTRIRIAQQRATRLTVGRSNSHIYAQIIDDAAGKTIASASSNDSDSSAKGANAAAAKAVGALIAKRAKDKGITRVVFDRGGYLYHGNVKALADSARENGLEF